jgi:aryl-alcohol dehydrogenase-like predicted oxidoreductase
MQIRRLGSSGPEISVIGYGAWEAGGTAWGPNPSEDGVIEAVRAGLDAGITWIDTAEVYGDGVSESLIGRAVTGRHDDVTIATKVGPEPEGSGFRPEQIRAACEASMRRLGVDHLDLYQLHWPDDEIPVEESWGAMAQLQEGGLVRWVGVSNFDRELIERCERIHHVDSLQPEFSMLVRDAAELIAWCGEQGIGVISYGPLAFGLLTGAISADTEFPDGDWRRPGDPDDPDRNTLFDADARPGLLEKVAELGAMASGLGISPAQLALAWNVAQPGVTAAIAGSRNPAHVRANSAAGDVDLDDATLAAISATLG